MQETSIPLLMAPTANDEARSNQSDGARIRFSSRVLNELLLLGSPISVSTANELSASGGLHVSSYPSSNPTGSGGGPQLNVTGEVDFVPWMIKQDLFGYDVGGLLTDEPSNLFRLSTQGTTIQTSIFDTPPPSSSRPLTLNISPEGFMAIDAGVKTTAHAGVVIGGTLFIVEAGGALIPASISEMALVQAGKHVVGHLIIWYGTAEGIKLTFESGNTLLRDPDASQQEPTPRMKSCIPECRWL